MDTRYSPSTRSFYPLDIQYTDGIPVDCITVPHEVYEEAMSRPEGSLFDIVDGAVVIVYPPAKTLDQLKATKLAELADAFAQRMGAVKAGYPDDEIQSWFDQKGEAVAFTANPAAATPLLSAMAGARGISVADLAARVLVKAAGYAETAGLLIGKRQRYEDAVNAATNLVAVSSIEWTD